MNEENYEAMADAAMQQPIHPDHHLIHLQYLVESDRPELVGTYIKERFIDKLLSGGIDKQLDTTMLVSIIHVASSMIERLDGIAGSGVHANQLFADVIRNVIEYMNTVKSSVAGLTVKLDETFPYDDMGGQSIKVQFKLDRAADK